MPARGRTLIPATPMTVLGHAFDSKLEGRVAGELETLGRAGLLTGWRAHVTFELASAVKAVAKTKAHPRLPAQRRVTYEADFVVLLSPRLFSELGHYTERSVEAVVEVKGGYVNERWFLRRRFFEVTHPAIPLVVVRDAADTLDAVQLAAHLYLMRHRVDGAA